MLVHCCALVHGFDLQNIRNLMWHLEPLAAKIQTSVISTTSVDHLMTADSTDHQADVHINICIKV